MTDNRYDIDQSLPHAQMYTCPRCNEPADMLFGPDDVCGDCHHDTSKTQGPPPGYYDERTEPSTETEEMTADD